MKSPGCGGCFIGMTGCSLVSRRRTQPLFVEPLSIEVLHSYAALQGRNRRLSKRWSYGHVGNDSL
jgi:hypothetical protein